MSQVAPPGIADDVLRMALERELLADIPLARAMQLAIPAWDGTTLAMAAPLAPNINDKGCAFGGSLASVMTLAGWALVRLAVDRAGLACDIYVQDSMIRYLAPVWGDFTAGARLADADSFEDFLDALRTRGKARAGVRCMIPAAGGEPAATLEARFVAIVRGDSSPTAANRAQSARTRVA